MPRKIGFAAVLLVAMVFISSCPEPTTSGTTTYDRIVIETYPLSSGESPTDTTLSLYDSSGTELAFNENIGAGNVASRIDYTLGLESGTYYIKIYSANDNPGPYVIRTLRLTLGESLPAYNYPGSGNWEIEPWPDGDDNSTGNIPDAPKPISLGSSNYLNRNLNKNTTFPPAFIGDIDWCELVLP